MSPLPPSLPSGPSRSEAATDDHAIEKIVEDAVRAAIFGAGGAVEPDGGVEGDSDVGPAAQPARGEPKLLAQLAARRAGPGAGG